MRSVEQLQDPTTIKLAAVLLEKENARLHERLEHLARENAALRGEAGSKQLALELSQLQERMALLQHQLYGRSSEQRPTPDKPPAPIKKKAVGHGPRPQLHLPQVDVLHELQDADQVCPLCGCKLCSWSEQSEDSEEITVVERRFELHVHRRKKYRCQQGCAPVTAPGPAKLIQGGRYALEFAVHVAVQKYLDHMPLERQVRAFAREGLVVDSQTLWDQIWALSQVLKPSYQALRPWLWAKPLLHADETRWPLLGKPGGSSWYVWSLAAPDAVFHQIMPGRSGACAQTLLQGYSNALLVDGYAAYQHVVSIVPSLTLLYCWAHVRRKFVQAERFEPACGEVLELIGQLYAVERTLPDPHLLRGADQAAALRERQQVRRAQSLPVLDQIHRWALVQQGLPQSTFRKAIDYMLSLWRGLTVFVEHPWAPLDNNLVERQLRDIVLGRKNHYGSRSERGTQVAALFYSLLETAKLRGADPARYLLQAARAALEHPGTITLPPLRS